MSVVHPVHLWVQGGPHRHLCGHRFGDNTTDSDEVSCQGCLTQLARRTEWQLTGKVPCNQCGGLGNIERRFEDGVLVPCNQCSGRGALHTNTPDDYKSKNQPWRATVRGTKPDWL